MIEWFIGGSLAGAVTSGSVMSGYLLNAYKIKKVKEEEFAKEHSFPYVNELAENSSVETWQKVASSSSPSPEASVAVNNRVESSSAFSQSRHNLPMRDIDKVQVYIEELMNSEETHVAKLVFYNFSENDMTIGIDNICPIWAKSDSNQLAGIIKESVIKLQPYKKNENDFYVIFTADNKQDIIKEIGFSIYDLQNYDKKTSLTSLSEI